MRGITRNTLSEMIDRKLIWIYVVITVLAILMILGSKGLKIEIEMQTPPGQENPFASMAQEFAVGSLDLYLWFLVFLTVMGTAGLIPSMLSKGRAEFYLSKPISRNSLLVNKLLSIWAVYGGAILAGAGLSFVIFYLAWGYGHINLFYMFLLYMVNLLIWLSVTTFAGVLSGSFAVSIMTAFLIYVVQYLLQFHEAVGQLVSSKFVTIPVQVLYWVLPKASEIAGIAKTVGAGHPVDDWLPLWTSLAFAIALILITLEMFRRKDF